MKGLLSTRRLPRAILLVLLVMVLAGPAAAGKPVPPLLIYGVMAYDPDTNRFAVNDVDWQGYPNAKHVQFGFETISGETMSCGGIFAEVSVNRKNPAYPQDLYMESSPVTVGGGSGDFWAFVQLVNAKDVVLAKVRQRIIEFNNNCLSW
jgi:hypothetical protein